MSYILLINFHAVFLYSNFEFLGVVKVDWYDGNNGFQYKPLEYRFSSYYSARMACVAIGADIITKPISYLPK